MRSRQTRGVAKMALVIKLWENDFAMIGDAKVTIQDARKGSVKLAIEAPASVLVTRLHADDDRRSRKKPDRSES